MSRLVYFVLIILFMLFNLIVPFANANPRELSLQDAIMLAVRENPNVLTSELNHVQQKFALDIQRWEFQPHFAFQASKTTSQIYSTTANGMVTSNETGFAPSVSLLTPIGTQVNLISTNNVTNHYQPTLSLQIMQPLMKGFGRPIVEAALNDAIDSEKISRLNVESQLRITVTSVINAYLDVISAENTLQLDKQALKRSEESIKQTKIFIQSGHKAGVELVTVEADAASAKTKIEADQNNVQQVRYALLTAIGLDPNSEFILSQIDIDQLIKKYHVPTLSEAQKMILENDIQYQIDNITLHGSTKRNLQTAEDNTRWQLNLTLNGSTGNASEGGINSLVNGVNVTDSAMLNLTIPIDDRSAKLAVTNAKIALQEANLALRQEKWAKETSIINSWNDIQSTLRAEKLSKNAADLQAKTYQIAFKKFSFGLIDALELQTAQQQYREAEQTALNAEMAYLKSLINLDLLVGRTLKTWDIKMQYGSNNETLY